MPGVVEGELDRAVDEARAEREHAARLHGVERVHRDVDERALDALRVERDAALVAELGPERRCRAPSGRAPAGGGRGRRAPPARPARCAAGAGAAAGELEDLVDHGAHAVRLLDHEARVLLLRAAAAARPRRAWPRIRAWRSSGCGSRGRSSRSCARRWRAARRGGAPGPGRRACTVADAWPARTESSSCVSASGGRASPKSSATRPARARRARAAAARSARTQLLHGRRSPGSRRAEPGLDPAPGRRRRAPASAPADQTGSSPPRSAIAAAAPAEESRAAAAAARPSAASISPADESWRATSCSARSSRLLAVRGGRDSGAARGAGRTASAGPRPPGSGPPLPTASRRSG